MLLTAETFSSLLQALGLTEGLFKPIPGIVGAVGGALHQTTSAVLGAVNDTTSIIGLPLPDLPLLGLLQNQNHSQAQTASATGVAADDVSSYGYDAPACQVTPYNMSVVPMADTIPAPFDEAKANIFRYRQQQSVNLGSWFVHENWMTPSLFTCAAGKQQSELDIASGWGGPENARAMLERHWDTFITRADLERLATLGINTVRLPIGYWSLGPGFTSGTDFDGVGAVYANSWPRVLRAINWAAEAGLGVLVDLHGAPSSQNGQSHSGVSTGEAGLWSNDSAVVQTLGVLSFLATQLAMVTNVVGIQILNEPKNVSGLADFYDRAIATMRVTSSYAQNLPLYVHDGFDLDRFSTYVANRSDFVVEDHHSYFVFTEADDAESASAHTVDIATGTKSMLAVAAARQRRNLIIGEWSCALTAKSLAGEVDLDAARTAFCAGQEAVYRNNTAGWAFWSYKLESADAGWSFITAVGNSLPATFFSFGHGAPADAEALASFNNIMAEMRLIRGGGATSPATGQPAEVESADDDADASEGVGSSGVSSMSSRSIAHGTSSVSGTHHASATTHASSAKPHATTAPARRSNRFAAVAARIHERDPSGTDGERAYTDGAMTAKIFAAHGLSRLGFVDQYVADTLAALGPAVIPPASAAAYSTEFLRGLRDAEDQIRSELQS